MPPATKKKKVVEVPKGPVLFPQPCRTRPLISHDASSSLLPSAAAATTTTTAPTSRASSRGGTPLRSSSQGGAPLSSPLGGGGIRFSSHLLPTNNAAASPLLGPEHVCTVLASPLNDAELDVPSLTENRTTELIESVEGYLKGCISGSIVGVQGDTGVLGYHPQYQLSAALEQSLSAMAGTRSRPTSPLDNSGQVIVNGRPQSPPLMPGHQQHITSTVTRVSRFTVTEERLLAMSLKEAIAAGLVPSPAISRAVHVARSSLIRQRQRAQRVTTPSTPHLNVAGGSVRQTAAAAPQINSVVTSEDLLEAGISPPALALCEAYESTTAIASRIAAGNMSSAEANLVKIMAIYKKVHPNNLLRIHEEISRNMGINTAELAFVEQRLASDIGKAVEGILKVSDMDTLESLEASAMMSSGGLHNRKQPGFTGFDTHMSSSSITDQISAGNSVSDSVSTAPPASPRKPLQKHSSVTHLESFLHQAPAKDTKIAVDTVAKLCAYTLGPALTERLPPVALLLLTLYCCSPQDVALLFPSNEGRESEELADMEAVLQERKKAAHIMEGARRSSQNMDGTPAEGKAAAASPKAAVAGVMEEIKLLRLKRVLLDRVKEAEKKKAFEYEAGFRNNTAHPHGGDRSGVEFDGVEGLGMGLDDTADGMSPFVGDESCISPSSPHFSPSSSFQQSPLQRTMTSPAEMAKAEMEFLRTPFYQASGYPRPVISITRSLEELRAAVQTAGVTTVLGGRKGLPTAVPTTTNSDAILSKWAGTVTVLVAAIHMITAACESAARAPPPPPPRLTSSPLSASTLVKQSGEAGGSMRGRRRTTSMRSSSPDYKGAPTFKASPRVTSLPPDPLGLPLGSHLQRAHQHVMIILPTVHVPSMPSASTRGGGGGRLSVALEASGASSVGPPHNNSINNQSLFSVAASPPRGAVLVSAASAFAGGTSSAASINLSPFVSTGAATMAHFAAIMGSVSPGKYLPSMVQGWINGTVPTTMDTIPPLPPSASGGGKKAAAVVVPHPAASVIPADRDTLSNNLLSSGYVPLRYRVQCGTPPDAMQYFRKASLEALRGIFMPPLLCPVTSNAALFSHQGVITMPIQRDFGEPIPPVLFDATVPEDDRVHALFDGWHVSKQPTIEQLQSMLAVEARGKQKGKSSGGGSDPAVIEMKIQAMVAAIALASEATAAAEGIQTKKPAKKAKKNEGLPLPMTREEEEVYLSRIPTSVMIELWVRPDIHAVSMSPLFSNRPNEEEYLLSPLLRFRIKRIDVPNMTLQLLVDTSPRQDEVDGSGVVVSFFKDVLLDATKASNTARRLCDRLISEFVPKYHCHRHPSQKYAFFCRTCRQLICLGCAREQHASHLVSPLPYFCHNEAVRLQPLIESLACRVTRLREVILDLRPKVDALTEVVDRGMVGVEARLKVHQRSLHVDADLRAAQQLRQIQHEKRRCLDEKANILRAKQALLLLQRGASKAVPKPLVPQTYFQISCKLSLALPSGDISKLIKVLTWSNPSKYLSPVIYPPPEAKIHAMEAVDNVLAHAAANNGASAGEATIISTQTVAAGGGEDGTAPNGADGGAVVINRRIPLTTTGASAATLAPTGSIGIGDERNIRLSVASISSRIDALTKRADEALSAVWADVSASAERLGSVPTTISASGSCVTTPMTVDLK